MKKTTALTLIAALAGALPCAAFAQQQQPQQQATMRQAPAAGASMTPGAVQDPAMAEQAGFERLLRAQVLLERIYLSPGEIDGAYGSNMRQALTTFQVTRKLPVTGKLDDATLIALNGDNAPTLTNYTLADEDTAGPFEPIPDTMMEKAKLSKLGYANVLEGLGEKFHASPALLQRLNPGKDFSRSGEQIVVPNVHGKAQLAPATRVVVRDGAKTLQLYDAAGALLAQYPASTGSRHDPLPVGTWKIEGVHANPVYNYNPKLFWDAKAGDRKTAIKPGPNNPVGVMWIDLSKPHYGIHGTPVPGHVGKTESHGCIRLTNWSAAEVGALVGAGVEVVLQK